MNFWTSQSRQSWFTYAVVVVRLIMEEGELVGQVILNGAEVTKRVKGETEHIQTCKAEGERVDALERWFEIRFREEERMGIRGMVTALHG